jgi:serine/threonine protein kinase
MFHASGGGHVGPIAVHPQQPHSIPPTTPAKRTSTIATQYTLDESTEKGRGGYSKVVPARCRTTGEYRAVKIMEKSNLTTDKHRAMVVHEKEVLRRTHHPNIIHLHECMETEHHIYVILDLMETDLCEYLRSGPKLSEEDVASIMRGLLSAVAYLHIHNIIHRDIKPENILINTPEDVRLADFGLAKIILPGVDVITNTPCGTTQYIAPEIVLAIQRGGNAAPQVTTRTTLKYIDMWSSGVVLYIMLCGHPPFSVGHLQSQEERQRYLYDVSKGVLFTEEVWSGVSSEAKDLVARLLTFDPAKRISALDAMKHPFLLPTFQSPTVGRPLTRACKMTRQQFAECVNDAHEAMLGAHDILGMDDGEHCAPPPSHLLTLSKCPQMTSKLMEKRRKSNQEE